MLAEVKAERIVAEGVVGGACAIAADHADRDLY
jgi:hypothetical protein